jgi:hypothetical protein
VIARFGRPPDARAETVIVREVGLRKNPWWGNRGFCPRRGLADNSRSRPLSVRWAAFLVHASARAAPRQGRCMDLAMAMGLALFGMFAGSTVLFFYRLGR